MKDKQFNTALLTIAPRPIALQLLHPRYHFSFPDQPQIRANDRSHKAVSLKQTCLQVGLINGRVSLIRLLASCRPVVLAYTTAS